MKSSQERREKILKILSVRKYEKISNLALELEVSKRTIKYDIELLSCTYPIYTITGPYGGVYFLRIK
jgi:DeoR/GlpR family transcriptional regulator of sugar metabolism